MKRVVVVGGGLTGLSTALSLERIGRPVAITLVEGSGRFGGNVQTVSYQGFTIDGGPDSWVASKPEAARLARELGLGDELIGTRPESRKVHIVWQRRLHPMPEGLVLGIPTAWRPFAETELLTVDGKLRAAMEPLVPAKRFLGDEDESIASFVGRRLGPQISERIVGPLLGGIFAGDPEHLSVRACVPQLVAAEATYGSLIKAMRELRRARRAAADDGEGEASAFLSLKRGMGDLVVNMVHRLKLTELRTSCVTHRIGRLPPDDGRGRWAVETSGGTLHADDVVLATPAHVARGLVGGVDPALESVLGGIDYVSSATVFFAFRRAEIDHPLDSVGFLVPRAEGRSILAGTFVSSKWEHRAPNGQVLMRVFLGGAHDERLAEEDDRSLVRIAREELLDLAGIAATPSFSKVFRFAKASPQMRVGHLVRMARLRERLVANPGLHIGGNGYVGTGMPDAIRQGEEIAQRIAGGSL